MKATLLLIVTVLITSVSAFGDAGIYERLWYWYAYTLDTSGSKIGPGCSKGPSRCTFVQFMTYIDQQTYEGVPETQSGVDPKEIAKTDPNDLKKAFDQLKNGHYSGPYWADKIHSDFSSTTRDDVSKLFLSIAGFVEGKIHDADPKMKQNLKDVTMAIAKERIAASVKGMTKDLAKGYKGHPPVILETTPAPIWEGSTVMVDNINWAATVRSSGMSKQAVAQIVAAKKAGDSGHQNNIMNAKQAAQMASDACPSEGATRSAENSSN